MPKMQSPKNSVSARRLLGFVVAAIIAFLLLISVITIAGKYFRIRREIRALRMEQATLQKKEQALEETNAYLDTPEGREQALRDKYNVVKPGEGMIVITPEETPQSAAPHQSAVSKWWDKILHGLGIRKD